MFFVPFSLFISYLHKNSLPGKSPSMWRDFWCHFHDNVHIIIVIQMRKRYPLTILLTDAMFDIFLNPYIRYTHTGSVHYIYTFLLKHHQTTHINRFICMIYSVREIQYELFIGSIQAISLNHVNIITMQNCSWNTADIWVWVYIANMRAPSLLQLGYFQCHALKCLLLILSTVFLLPFSKRFFFPLYCAIMEI